MEAKNKLSGKLEIYNDKTLVNTIEFESDNEVKDQLIKILIADKKRGVKTTYKPIPYTNDIEIVQKYNKTKYHLKYDTKYVYEFKNIDY